MSVQVRLAAGVIGGTIETQYSGTVSVGSDGTITVDSRDVATLLAAGAQYVSNSTILQSFRAPRGATAGRIVASATLSSGSMTIANQPDSPRQCAMVIYTGTSPITAGNYALNYTANDGTSQTDSGSLVATSGLNVTTTTSKGVLHLSSAVISNLAGGGAGGMQINDTNSLSMVVQPGFVDFTVLKENVDGADETIGTVASTAASVTPTTAPNATHNFDFAASFVAPNA
jgi:hypothetical protein